MGIRFVYIANDLMLRRDENVNKRICRLLITALLLFGTTSKYAVAFTFETKSATAYLDATLVPTTLGNIVSGASGEAAIMVTGYPNPSDKDYVIMSNITVSKEVTSRGFTVDVGVKGYSWRPSASATGTCVFYKNCDTSQASWVRELTTPVYVRLKRTSTDSYSTIPSGTLITSIKLLQFSSHHPTGDQVAYLYFYSNGDIMPKIRTCDIKNFDNNVTLPDVRRADLVNHGAGRYTGVTKEFNINLACENKPKVSVKFNGDKMPGIASEDVLVNKLSGNDNIGIQLFYKSNAMKIGENIELLSAAADSENLKFNAYYYYKGGAVQSGPIKSQTEFTFTYE
ncbi:fimbrial protein [Phytobacter diazotrophicus]|uniref:fimbrial protein n=1 Tax=Phytobacter diazotrophicus TaxID=395631 RepID=UPI002FF91939